MLLHPPLLTISQFSPFKLTTSKRHGDKIDTNSQGIFTWVYAQEDNERLEEGENSSAIGWRTGRTPSCSLGLEKVFPGDNLPKFGSSGWHLLPNLPLSEVRSGLNLAFSNVFLKRHIPHYEWLNFTLSFQASDLDAYTPIHFLCERFRWGCTSYFKESIAINLQNLYKRC